MPYIGTQPKDVRSFGKVQFDFTATQGQTAFTGADDDGKTLGFTEGQIQVYVNGILMDASDYTTSNTNTVTLVSAANLNDIITVVALQTDIPNSDYVPISGGTFTGDVTLSSDSPNLRLTDTDTALSNNELSSQIEFYQSDASGAGVGASIGAYGDGSTGALDLRFATNNNTERMRIDSSGRVTMPYQPAFDVAWSGSNYSTKNPVIFDQVFLNVGGHYSTTTGRFTCPVDGVYFFYTSFIKNNTTAVARRRFEKNGSILVNGRHQRMSETSANTYGDNGTYNHMVECDAGDYITVNHYAGTSYGNNDYDYFGGYLIG